MNRAPGLNAWIRSATPSMWGRIVYSVLPSMRYAWSEALAKRRRYFSRLDRFSSWEKYPGSLIADMKMAGCSERSRQRAEVPDFIAPITNRLGALAIARLSVLRSGRGLQVSWRATLTSGTTGRWVQP